MFQNDAAKRPKHCKWHGVCRFAPGMWTRNLLPVNSMTAVPLKFDELGVDVLLAGTQKAFAMPPGFAVFVCSPAALAKAATMKDRGYYFDFVEFKKNAEKSMKTST